GTGPREFSSRSIEAVKGTMEWLQRDGAPLHNKVAQALRADPNLTADLVEAFETADAKAQADQGMLSRKAMEAYRRSLMTEAVGMVRAENPSMPISDLARLEGMAQESLRKLQ